MLGFVDFYDQGAVSEVVVDVRSIAQTKVTADNFIEKRRVVIWNLNGKGGNNLALLPIPPFTDMTTDITEIICLRGDDDAEGLPNRVVLGFAVAMREHHIIRMLAFHAPLANLFSFAPEDGLLVGTTRLANRPQIHIVRKFTRATSYSRLCANGSIGGSSLATDLANSLLFVDVGLQATFATSKPSSITNFSV